jgi:glycerophosphoryl diester phosphodiesterase
LIFAHRGASGRYVENTVRAVDAALALDADGLEIDVVRAADGAVVVFHDDDLVRLGGRPETVEQLTAAELRAVGLVRNERIACLRDVLGRWPADRWLNIELKRGGKDLAAAVLAAVAGRPRVILSSGSSGALDALSELDAPHELAVVLGAESAPWLHERGARHYGASAVHLEDALCVRRSVARYLAEGLAVGAYTINDGARAHELAGWGVTRLFTDWP